MVPAAPAVVLLSMQHSELIAPSSENRKSTEPSAARMMLSEIVLGERSSSFGRHNYPFCRDGQVERKTCGAGSTAGLEHATLVRGRVNQRPVLRDDRTPTEIGEYDRTLPGLRVSKNGPLSVRVFRERTADLRDRLLAGEKLVGCVEQFPARENVVQLTADSRDFPNVVVQFAHGWVVHGSLIVG